MKRNGLYIDEFGDKRWYKDDLWHRQNGPAVEYAGGSKIWIINGLWHREDGPAAKWVDGDEQWWLDDDFYGNEKPDNWDELVLISCAKKLCDL
jgi:hypothetical protein